MTEQSGPPCKGALNIKGEHFPCDWQPTDADGTHKGWGHTNKDAEAVWTSGHESEGLPHD